MTLAHIARRAGVGRAAVVNWRRRHDDFPPAIGGTEESPQFDPGAVDAWLRAHDKVSEEPKPKPPPPPALIDFGGGCTVTMRGPSLDPEGDELVLGGYVDQEWEPNSWPYARFTAVLPSGERLTVDRAHVDLKGYGLGHWRYLRLTWDAPPPAPQPRDHRSARAEEHEEAFYTDADDDPRPAPFYRSDPYAAPTDGEASSHDGRLGGPALDW
ncbi:hypothetical protein [Streptomyces jumonjinensis]|uniref:hypothetical protein n=1 Tax=Streptomyces jumonjinensis TaxID=1945 RepID=UPI0037BDFADF